MIPFLKSIFVKAVYFQSATGNLITGGSGSPEGVVAAPVGSVYFRSDGGPGTFQYNKESGTGNTGWVAVVGGSGLAHGAVMARTSIGI